MQPGDLVRYWDEDLPKSRGMGVYLGYRTTRWGQEYKFHKILRDTEVVEFMTHNEKQERDTFQVLRSCESG